MNKKEKQIEGQNLILELAEKYLDVTTEMLVDKTKLHIEVVRNHIKHWRRKDKMKFLYTEQVGRGRVPHYGPTDITELTQPQKLLSRRWV